MKQTPSTDHTHLVIIVVALCLTTIALMSPGVLPVLVDLAKSFLAR